MKSIKYLALLLLIVPFIFSCSDNTTETTTVATPVISPNGGTFMAAQTVTITCSTLDAYICYTLDGTEPDSLDTVYSAPLTVSSNKTIKAKAYKAGWNHSLTATADFVIYDQMEFVQGGTFTMGRTIGTGFADELPTHPVTVGSFYIGKHEVKQSEWYAIMGNNPSTFTGNNDRPVEEVNFYSVLVYCNKRSIAEGLSPVYSISGSTNPNTWGTIPTTNNATWNAATCNWTANGYRLPTEAEWEYAARGGTNNPDFLYSGSDTIGLVAWYDANASNTTHPVEQKSDNAFGLFDMSGNVQEWVWDWYGENYYSTLSTTTATNNPTGPATGTVHVMRGGSWNRPAADSRVAFRNWGSPEKGDTKVANSALGFRVVRLAD